jgi:hypothetical protein
MKRARAPESTGDKLRDLLRQQTQAATDEALRSGGEVPAEKLESLTSLARLIELRQAAQPPIKLRRWPVILVLAGTLLIVSVLFFARLAETEVELDLALNELGFTLSREQVLADSMNLSALGISGMAEVQLPLAGKPENETLRESDGTMSSLQLSSTLAGKRQGSISLATLAFPIETRVWLRQTEVPHQYRLSLKGPSLKLQADVNGPLQIALAGRGIEQRDFQTPRALHMQAGADEVDLDLTLPETAKGALSSQLSASDVSLFHVDEFQNSDQTLVRQLSTVLSGTIYFSALNDQQRQLRQGETIRFEKSDGEFRTIRMQDDHIDVKFHGRVRGLTIGTGENRRSLMPTWLDWLRAHHGLSLLWGSAFYLFGLIVGVLRWWEKPL